MARPGFSQHRKWHLLTHILPDCYPALLRGCIEFLWESAYAQGRAYVGNALAVELAAKWPGHRGQLCKALVESGFLDQIAPDEYEVHDLEANAPAYVKKRIATEKARREQGKTISDVRRDAVSQRKDRQNHPEPPPESTNGHESVQTVPTCATGGTNCQPPRTDQTRPEQEETASQFVPQRSEAERVAPATKPLGAVMEFPVKGKEKVWWLTEAKLAEYVELFPGLDILREFQFARQWCVDRVADRKTHRGMPAFLTNWLKGATDGRGSRRRNSSPNLFSPRSPEQPSLGLSQLSPVDGELAKPGALRERIRANGTPGNGPGLTPDERRPDGTGQMAG